MHTKIIIENENKDKTTLTNQFELKIQNAIYLSLLENGLINQIQYNKCTKKM